MAIKKAQYKITLASGENVYHFETGDEMVKIVDSNGSVLGSFKEFGMEGRVVTSGSFKDLKITGLYKVSKLAGLPSGYNVDKISILSVKAIGKVGSPELVSYELISQSGEIFHNTMIGGTLVGWSEGGTSLKNLLTQITNQLGDTTKLNTSAKTSLVSAVNEVLAKANTTASNLSSLTKEYNDFHGHDHDSKYIVKSGDTVTGDIVWANGKSVNAKKTTGETINLISTDTKNNILVGNTGIPILVSGSDMKFNGKKVWHEGNDGDGSGLDADKLGGVDNANFARTDKLNDFKQDVKVSNRKSVYIEDGSLFFGGDYATHRGRILVDANGRMDIYNNQSRSHSITGDGAFESWSGHNIFATNREAHVKLRLNGSDAGMGMYRNGSSKYLGFYNWEKGQRIAYADEESSVFYFDKEIAISGRKLYLQSATPSGARTTGDIWIS